MSQRRAQSATLAALALALGCVSTNLDETAELPVCAAALSPGRATAALPGGSADQLVKLSLDAPPDEVCTGVPIAPTLLVTAVNCVTLLATDSGEAGFTPPECESNTGAPNEQGNFYFRYSRPATPEEVLILHEDGTPYPSSVRRVLTSDKASLCMPDIAVIQLQTALDLPVVPLRLEDATAPGTEVIVSGFDLSEDSTRHHATSATILEATSDTGSTTLAPRSLLLSGQTCALPGSAVLDAATGALIGLTQTSSRSLRCTEGMGSPIAANLAPFRQFLLEAALAAETSLVSEPRLNGPSPIAACADDPSTASPRARTD